MVAALIRQIWSSMQEVPRLLLDLEWWRAYYHFVRPHESLQQRLAHPLARGGKRQEQR
jgi:transposase InsO family protein